MSWFSQNRLTALALAVAGAVVFVLIGFPLPLLLGPMAGCLLGALAGAKMEGMGQVGMFFRTFLGVAVGSSLTPDIIERLPTLGLSLAMVPIYVIVIGALGYPLFRKVFKFDKPTSYYSAMPGGLQDMLVFGEEAGADVRALSLIHATRILVIVTVVPFILTVFWGVDLTAAPGVPLTTVPVRDLLIMLAAAVIGWKGGERIGLFGASILGPLLLTAILSLTGVIEGRPPAEVIWIAQFFIGIAVGVKYTGITGKELRVDVSAGIAYAVLLAIVSLVFIEILVLAKVAPPRDILLSFMPGGQAEMAVIALIAGADLAFIVIHHLLRIFLVILLAPIIARWM